MKIIIKYIGKNRMEMFLMTEICGVKNEEAMKTAA
jgi:hypothetical protein